MKNTTEIQAALAEKFAPEDLEYRIGRSGIKNHKPWATVLAYVTNRAIQERLDDVLGIANWKNEYRDWHGSSVLCGLSLKIEGEWITKWDGADETQIESTKGGLSNAMKRTAVQFGIGRYLYKFSEEFANCFDNSNGEFYARFEDKKSGEKIFGSWNKPALPEWAMPDGTKEMFYNLVFAGTDRAWEFYVFARSLSEETYNSLIFGFPTGQKVEMKSRVGDINEAGSKIYLGLVDQIKLFIEKEDVNGIYETVNEMTTAEKRLIMRGLTEDEVAAVVAAKEEVEGV